MIKTQDVIDYLKQHPSFLKENEELLCHLDIGDGNAMPFHERQIKVLQERENKQQTRFDFIVDSAKNNQRLESDLLEMAIRLLSSTDEGKGATATVSALVKRQFNVHDVVVLLDDPSDCRHVSYDDVRQRVVHHSSICDDRVPSDLLEALFNENFQSIKSCAFVPVVFADELIGVMVLGSSSEVRFQPGIGVVFLNRLGRLLGGYFQGNKNK